MKHGHIYIGLVALLGLAVAAWLTFSPSQDISATASADNPGFVLSAYDRTLGNPKAPITLIEYAALVCPHCARFEMQEFPALKASYIDTGKIFYVFRAYPIRPDDGPAEKLARCMPEDKYFSFVDLLYHNQPKWDGAEYPVPDDHAGLVMVARIAGMSPEQADKCMKDKSLDKAINQVSQDGEQKYHLTGTPTFVVNGAVGEAGELWPHLRSRLDTALAAKSGAR